MQLLEEPIVHDELRFEIVQLGDAERRGLSHIRIFIVQTFSQGLTEVVDDLLRAQTAHGPDRQRAHERIGIVGILHERVDGEDDEFRLRLGVIHEIEIDELFLLEVVRLHVLEHVRKETTDIFHGLRVSE